MSIVVSVLGILALASHGLAHVALTFPQAKYPQYDFLDNTRTGPPCGITEPASMTRTTLVAGEYYNFTFHLAYPHAGAFCFNILDEAGKATHQLTDGFVESDLSTSQQYMVKMPNITCPKCTVQLVRQALEWVGPQSYQRVYIFWSCAAVTVVAASNAKPECGGTDCTGHGMCSNGTCICTGTWYGNYCQYKDGCLTDADCSGHGSCISLSSTSAPRAECFCNAGWQGLACETASPLTSASFDPATYKGYLKARDNLEYWFNHNGDYVEVAIKYSGTGEWVGFGFRPTSLSSDCWKTAPGYLPAEALGKTDIKPWGGAPNGESWGTPIGSSSEEEGEEAGGGLHAMDCTDMVISRVKGNQYRILDYYTRDRSTPQVDNWYGGEQNLTAAIGAVVDGVTWIRFRKPTRKGADNFDHDIANAPAHIIWAHGQVIGSYDPAVPTSTPANSGLITNFYQPLELKYHGANNRGATTNNFVDPFTVTCSYTSVCGSAGQCYSATWGLLSTDDTVLVVELTLGDAASKWVGMGYSNDNMMPMSDIITGYISGETTVVQDRYATAKALPPVDDSSQIIVSAGTLVDGKLTIQFQRKLVSTDAKDVSVNTPRYLLFAWGDLAAGNSDIAYHGANKAPTSTPIDVTSCNFGGKLLTSDARGNVASILLLFVASLSAMLLH